MKTALFNYPEYAQVGNKKYKINTDYRVAIRCNEISMDESIDIIEKGLAIIYLLFGDDGLYDTQNHEELAKKAEIFLKCGIDDEVDESEEKEPDFDFIQDFPYIEASFKSDYGIDINEEPMHWWKFYYLFCGLSQSEFGNSCVINRIRDLRNINLSKIEDFEERKKIEQAQKRFALKKKEIKEVVLTEEENKSVNLFYEQMGIDREE